MMARVFRFLLRMLPSMAAAAPVIALARYFGIRRLGRRGLATTPRHEAGLWVFLLFLAGLAALTILPRNWVFTAPDWGRVNLRPLRVFRDSWVLWRGREDGSYFVINVLGNILMFLPLGLFPRLLWGEKKFGLLRSTGAGLAASVYIEFCQLFQNRGTDVDDLWLNALGGALGYGVYWVLRRGWPEWVEGFRVKED